LTARAARGALDSLDGNAQDSPRGLEEGIPTLTGPSRPAVSTAGRDEEI